MAAGDFWPITLDDGRFGAGRVLRVVSRVIFLGCVLDWSSDRPPTSESLAGAGILVRHVVPLALPHRKPDATPDATPVAGEMHIKAIADCGSGIAGHRGLELDDIEVPVFRTAHFGGDVVRGAEFMRKATSDDEHLPILSGWGFQLARTMANLHFCASH